MIVVAMLLSGGVAGLIWMPALFGGAGSYGTSFQVGLGFTGLGVALLGRNQPLGMLFGAVLFAFLTAQSNTLTFSTDISPSIVQITQGVAVLAVVVAYEVVRRWRSRLEQRVVAQRARTGGSRSMTTTLVQTARKAKQHWFLAGARRHRRRVARAHRLRHRRHLLARHHPRGDHRHLPDPHGGTRRPLGRARRRRQHRPRGPDDPRHLGRRVLHLPRRAVGRRGRRGAVRRHRRPAARGGHGDVRRRPHRVRRGDQPDRRRCRDVPRRGDLPRPARAAARASSSASSRP